MSFADDIASLNFGSIQRAGEGFRDLGAAPSAAGVAVAAALDMSETRALRLARGILATAPSEDTAASEATAMVEWAAKTGSSERQLVGRALRLSQAGLFAVDRIGTLPRARARPFMVDYLAAGGDLREIAQWLEVVGGVLRRHHVKDDGTAGVVVDVVNWVADRAEDAVDAIGEAVETVVDAVEQAGHAIADVVSAAVSWTAEQVANVVQALVEAGRTVGDILATAVGAGSAALARFVRAIVEAGRAVGEVLSWAVAQVAGTLREVIAALRAAGAAVLDMLRWAVGQAANVARAVIRALVEAGTAIVDLVASVATAGLAAMRAVVDGLFAIGRTLADLLQRVAGLALDALELFIRAAIDLGRSVIELGRAALALTYRAIAKVVKAAFAAGVRAVELLGAVVGAGYFALRKMVSGILDAAGPVGDVLEWALDRLEQAADNVFRDVIGALRFAEARLTDALAWAAARGDEALAAVAEAWEAAGENLIDLYRWARSQGEAVWEQIGRFTQRLHNSVRYVLVYLEKDFVPGVRRFVVGLLEAGYQLGDLVVRLARRTAELVVEVVGAVLDLGFTIAELLVATLADPRRLMDNVLAGLRAAGRTARDIYAAAEDAGGDAIEELTLAWRRLRAPLQEMLAGVFEVGGGALGTVVSLLLNQLATYRALTGAEKQAARRVFGDSIDLDSVSVSAESLDNEIIFGIQNFFDGTPDSRAFVTTTLINFDASQGIDTPTLIHELTHVWQALVTGPFYLSEAIHAQVTDPNAYNYGYTDSADGTGGADDLLAANGDFDRFNREQQGQIAMHYYVRRHELEVTNVLRAANSDLGGGTGFNKELRPTTTTPGSITVTVAAGATEDSYGYTPPGVPGNDGFIGPMTVRLAVSSGNGAVRASVAATRVDKSGVQQAISPFRGDVALPPAGGTLDVDLPATNLGPWGADDRLRLVYRFRNTDAAAPQSFIIQTGTSESAMTARKDWTPWRPYIDVIQAAA